MEQYHVCDINDVQEIQDSKPSDLSNISSVVLSFWKDDVNFLEKFPNLKKLSFYIPTRSKLRTSNKNDICNQISKLINLTDLSLNYFKLGDISFLESLKNLENLDLTGNDAHDIDVLRKLPALKKLIFKSNKIEDFETLLHLKRLKYLDIDTITTDYKEIKNVSCIGNIKTLVVLKLLLLDHEDIDFSNLINLKYLELRNIKLHDDAIIHITEILPNLVLDDYTYRRTINTIFKSI